MHLISTISVHYVHYEKQNMSYKIFQDLKETGKSLVMFKFKLGYCEEQLLMTLSVSSDKNGVFYGRCTIDFYKIVVSQGCNGEFQGRGEMLKKFRYQENLLLTNSAQVNINTKLQPLCKSTIVEEGGSREVFRIHWNIYDGFFLEIG